MKLVEEEIIKGRFSVLVNNKVIEVDSTKLGSTRKEILCSMKEITDEYDEFFIPGTIMLSDKATFHLRMQESCE